MATAENMVTALTTDADKPAIIANPHNKETISIVLISFPFFNLSKGLSRTVTINKTMPTCSPETAKICTAPALAYSCDNSLEIEFRCPRINAFITANSSPLNPFKMSFSSIVHRMFSAILRIEL